MHVHPYHSGFRRSKPRSYMPSREGPQHPTLSHVPVAFPSELPTAQSRQCLPRPAPITRYTARSRGIPGRGLSQPAPPAPPAEPPPSQTPGPCHFLAAHGVEGKRGSFPIPMCHRRPSGWEDHRLGVAIPRHRLPSRSRSNACSWARTITSITRSPLHILACSPSPFPAVEACTGAQLGPGSWHRIWGSRHREG
jgi:hypothetical protein